MTASAVCLALLGAACLFAPEELTALLAPGAGGHVFAQVLGAALLGFAAMNWIARGAVLGGIYGRAVVAGNQAHLTIGAVILVTRGLKIGTAPPAYWGLTGLYLLGAAYFTYLTFFSSGLPRRSAGATPQED